MALLAAQISLFNALDPNLSAPLTLTVCCHSTASASTTCSTSIHTHTQFNLQGPSDDQSMVMKTTSNGLRTHPSSSVADAVRKRTRQEAAHHTLQVLSLYGCPFGYPHTTCSSVCKVEMADFGDFEMGDAVCLQGQVNHRCSHNR
ncbi:uncharacterized protein FOMMEDRAFT_17847 [Fomitiporia mediterranea MF3/22]|uniref:uncharacterized protein n=1 Tax=Fomitiporia mediterranea (strain MF3/22) TaxID=694068 RepID=UPI0004408A3B|nr:uncharacterized protein FOMMEDRAFT_17847 [Fomitiporia mediterranea MF3/22]EJD05562.1 hypothetical protein FOMMEDRAFT_17847 [Fomitiporia mediterranea MF3/22]